MHEGEAEGGDEDEDEKEVGGGAVTGSTHVAPA